MGKLIEMPRCKDERWRMIARLAHRVLLVSGRVRAADVETVRSLHSDPRMDGLPLMVVAPHAPAARIEQLLHAGASVVFNMDAFSRAADRR